jgi:uroporphyrinogen decarboxylase
MNSIERLRHARTDGRTDRIPFMPTILEHAAAVVGATPSAAALDAGLLAKAHIQAWRCYRHDAVTVGIDVYNAEAEALGCKVRFYSDNSIPGIVGRPAAGLEMAESVRQLRESIKGATARGRLPMLLAAANKVKLEIGGEVPVGLGVIGPFSLCCELMGFENFILACSGEPEASGELLDIAASFLTDWCSIVCNEGIAITIFESWAAPPLLSPGLYRRFVVPWEKSIINSMRKYGSPAPALVIGGNTLPMLDDILSTGTGMVIADFNADLRVFVDAARGAKRLLRGNIDPRLVASGPVCEIQEQAKRLIREASGYTGFVLGTGVLPYNTPKEHILALYELLCSHEYFC